MRIRNFISVLVILIILTALTYIGGALHYRSPYPGDLFHRFSKTSLTLRPGHVRKVFSKYATVSDYVVNWRDVPDREHYKWDSSWTYVLSIQGHNNLSTPVSLDSVLIYGAQSQISRCVCYHEVVEGDSSFFEYINMTTGEWGEFFIGNPWASSPQDSTSEKGFLAHSITYRLFTSAGSWIGKPNLYITSDFPEDRRDSIFVEQ